jgi:hypothetical protein
MTFAQLQPCFATASSGFHRTFLAALVFVGLAVTMAAAPNDRATPRWRYRHSSPRSPTVSATQIAFAYANNIWIVERSRHGAPSHQFPGLDLNPHFSPDGKWPAFSGEYAGNNDVYVVPSEGGEPKRLTWRPDPTWCKGGLRRQGGDALLARDMGPRAALRDSGLCPPTAASRSQCPCLAPIRARFRRRYAHRLSNE